MDKNDTRRETATRFVEAMIRAQYLPSDGHLYSGPQNLQDEIARVAVHMTNEMARELARTDPGTGPL